MQDLKYPLTNKLCSMHFWASLFVSHIDLCQIGLHNFSPSHCNQWCSPLGFVLLARTICCVWYSSLLSIEDLTVQVVVLRSPSSSCFWRSQFDFGNCLLQWQVSYLRYGLMVRHIIDTKSPVYGLTMESLREGDASFSLTIMGLERTSMQPIFHLEVRSP